MNQATAEAPPCDKHPPPPALTERQMREIAFCGRKAEMCLRGALHADEDRALTKDPRYRSLARESRQDALEYSDQAFRIAQGPLAPITRAPIDQVRARGEVDASTPHHHRAP